MKLKLFSLAAGLLLVLAMGVYLAWKSVPLLLGGIVGLVPVTWEEKLGQAVVAGMTEGERSCSDEATQAMLNEVVGRLQSAMPVGPYRFRVKVVRNPEVNALAAPGGHIVLFSGLLKNMDNAEQVAAVVAHEMQHVVQRHTTRGMVRALGLQAILTLTIGDPGLLGELAGNLTVMHFMRSDEQSADDEALKVLMRAGIAPMEMKKAFENLAKASGAARSEPVLKYLSSHPPLSERIERVAQQGAGWRGPARPLETSIAGVCPAR